MTEYDDLDWGEMEDDPYKFTYAVFLRLKPDGTQPEFEFLERNFSDPAWYLTFMKRAKRLSDACYASAFAWEEGGGIPIHADNAPATLVAEDVEVKLAEAEIEPYWLTDALYAFEELKRLAVRVAELGG